MAFPWKLAGASLFGLPGLQAYSTYEAANAAEDAAAAGIQAQREAIGASERAAAEAGGYFEPYQDVGLAGAEQAGFLADPQAQYKFLQNNPLFLAALENANRMTTQRAAAGGRLGTGDTQSELFQNYLLAGSPLIDRQRQDINNLLTFGAGIAGNRANIRTGAAAQQIPLISNIGDIQGAGIIGKSNAYQQGVQNITGLAAQAAGYGGFGGFGGFRSAGGG